MKTTFDLTSIVNSTLYTSHAVEEYLNQLNPDQLNEQEIMRSIEYLDASYVVLSGNKAEEGILMRIRNAIVNLIARLFNNLRSHINLLSGYVKRSESQAYRQTRPMNVNTVERKKYLDLAEMKVPTFIYKVGPVELGDTTFALAEAIDIPSALNTVSKAVQKVSSYLDTEGTSMDLYKELKNTATPISDVAMLKKFATTHEANTISMGTEKMFADYFNSVETYKRFNRLAAEKSHELYNKIHKDAKRMNEIDSMLDKFIKRLDSSDNTIWVKDNRASIDRLATIVQDVGSYVASAGLVLKLVNFIDHFSADCYQMLYDQVK